jgi:hypothetical protein
MQGLWDNNLSSNFRMAMAYMHQMDDGDGVLNFREVLALEAKYPNIFFPLYNLQVQVMRSTLGEFWWEAHKLMLHEMKEKKQDEETAQLKKRQKVKAKAKVVEEDVNETMLQKRMGVVYYLMPWRRAQERNRIAKIAAIEYELEQQTAKLRAS